MLVRSGMDARLAGGVFLVVPADPTSSAHRRSRAAGPGTGTGRSSGRRAGRRTGGLHDDVPPGQAPSGQRSGDDGRRPSGHRKDLGPPRRRIRPDRADGAASISASLEGPRAACGAVGGGSRRDAYSGEVGRRQEEHRRRGARWCACRVARSSGTRVGGRDHPGKRGDRSRRARGGAGDGVQRLGAVVALWSAGRSWCPAGWWAGRTPCPAGGRVTPRPGQSRRCREGPRRPAGGPLGPLWPAGGLRRPC